MQPFATRAWRRPVTAAEVAPYEQLVQDVERAVEVLCIIWTRCELELPRTIHCDGHLDVDRERLRQLDSATRDKDAMLRNQVQPGVGLNLRI